MLTMQTAYTLETDDVDYALAELRNQLKLEQDAEQSAAGLLICHPYFMESGVAQAVSHAMPFPVVGGAFLGSICSGVEESLMLTLLVITGEDVGFSVMETPALADKQTLAASYATATSNGALHPVMMISLFPAQMRGMLEEALSTMDQVTGGVPVFGAICSDLSSDASTACTLVNGRVHPSSYVSLLLFGDVHPQFYAAAISEKNFQRQRAVITKSRGNVVRQINGIPAAKYLASIGLLENGKPAEGLTGVPFLLRFQDSDATRACCIYTINAKGEAVFSCPMPENALLSVGAVRYGDVLRMTEEAIKQALSTKPKGGMLLFPCASQLLALGADGREQQEIMLQLMPEGGLPYLAGYCSGEICPALDENQVLRNRFLCYSLAVCVL